VHRIAEKLLPFLKIIVDKFDPEQVVLFGSYAYGNPSAESDVDLLVVKNVKKLAQRGYCNSQSHSPAASYSCKLAFRYHGPGSRGFADATCQWGRFSLSHLAKGNPLGMKTDENNPEDGIVGQNPSGFRRSASTA
jgi:hypothetical protein